MCCAAKLENRLHCHGHLWWAFGFGSALRDLLPPLNSPCSGAVANFFSFHVQELHNVAYCKWLINTAPFKDIDAESRRTSHQDWQDFYKNRTRLAEIGSRQVSV
jgi:hypothetical protein